MKDLCSDGNVLYLGCPNANILVVILFSVFARGYHWGILAKAYTDLFYNMFLQLHVNTQFFKVNEKNNILSALSSWSVSSKFSIYFCICFSNEFFNSTLARCELRRVNTLFFIDKTQQVLKKLPSKSNNTRIPRYVIVK